MVAVLCVFTSPFFPLNDYSGSVSGDGGRSVPFLLVVWLRPRKVNHLVAGRGRAHEPFFNVHPVRGLFCTCTYTKID